MTAVEGRRSPRRQPHRLRPDAPGEDVRFLRGQGNPVDDVNLPGMLHGAILRSPFAHARIVSIDTSAAEALPGVKAVITGETLAGLGPRVDADAGLSYDTQAVLATDKVRFQGQEVAFVVGRVAHVARDALELIDVEYDPLPAVVDAKKALEPDAPIIRDDKEGKTDNIVYELGGRRQGGHRGVRQGRRRRHRADPLPARAPAPMETTCGSVAHMDPVTGKLTLWTTTQAPHAHRTVYAPFSPVCPSTRSR